MVQCPFVFVSVVFLMVFYFQVSFRLCMPGIDFIYRLLTMFTFRDDYDVCRAKLSMHFTNFKSMTVNELTVVFNSSVLGHSILSTDK